jgi:hypothetical protein
MKSLHPARRSGAAIALLAVIGTGCVGGDRPQQADASPDASPDPSAAASPGVVVHPQQHRLLSSAPGVRVIDVPSGGAVAGSQLVASVQRLSRFDGAAAVGVADGDPELTLGTITAAAFLADGTVALADRDFAVVRLLRGAAAARLGRPGEGPGELISPIAVAEDARGRLLVLNRTGGPLRVERFRRGPGGFEFDTRLPLRLYPGDAGSALCAAAGRTWATGVLLADEARSAGQPLEGILASRALVHELDDEGSIVHSFSVPYGPRRRPGAAAPQAAPDDAAGSMELDVLLQLGSARMTCDALHGGRLWVGFSGLGEVHLHTAAGELQWIARLRDFERSTLHETTSERGTSLGGDPAQTFPVVRDRISDVSLLASDVLAVQVTRTRTQRDRQRDFSYRTYLLDAGSGAVLGSFEADHRIMVGSGGRAVLYREAPHPQVLVTSPAG